MLTRYKGGANVKGGFYWNIAQWEVVTVEGKKGTLPADPGCEYMRVPTLAFIPLALVASGLYVIFLPFIGFAMLASLTARAASKRLFGVTRWLARKLAMLTAPDAGLPAPRRRTGQA